MQQLSIVSAHGYAMTLCSFSAGGRAYTHMIMQQLSIVSAQGHETALSTFSAGGHFLAARGHSGALYASSAREYAVAMLALSNPSGHATALYTLSAHDHAVAMCPPSNPFDHAIALYVVDFMYVAMQ